MSLLEAILLGIIQGLTEFLPVSSSGHLELGRALLNIQTTDSLTFTVITHGATVLSTIVVFRHEILSILKGVFTLRWTENHEYTGKLILSMIPVGVLGIVGQEQVEGLFTGQLALVGSALLLTGIILLLTTRVTNQGKNLKASHAGIIGLAQAVAVIPGISRSGATIGTALLMGVDRDQATRFSFLMVLVPVIGATALKVQTLATEGSPAGEATSVAALIAGFVAAFIAGLIACKWMIKLVRRGQLLYFGIYCLVVGVIAIGSTFV
jgi:undecaprenyl-diphosphatase